MPQKSCRDALVAEATDDDEMPRRVKRAKDAAIDRIWPDIEQDPHSAPRPDLTEEIMWDLAL